MAALAAQRDGKGVHFTRGICRRGGAIRIYPERGLKFQASVPKWYTRLLKEGVREFLFDSRGKNADSDLVLRKLEQRQRSS